MEWLLRLLILLIGLIVIALLYYFSTRQKRGRGSRRGAGEAGRDAGGQQAGGDDGLAPGEGELADPVFQIDDEPPPPPPPPLPRATGEPVLDRLGRGPDDEHPGAASAGAGTRPSGSGADGGDGDRDGGDGGYAAGAGAGFPSGPRGGELLGMNSVTNVAEMPAGKPPMVDVLNPTSPGERELNVVLLIRAPRDAPFQGLKLLSTLQAHDYALNEKNTWDYCPHDLDRPLFSIGHLLEPGTLEISALRDLETPGLVLFAKLARDSDLGATEAVSRMLDAARRLSDQLGGELFDEYGQPLNAERQNELRNVAAALDRRQTGLRSAGRQNGQSAARPHGR